MKKILLLLFALTPLAIGFLFDALVSVLLPTATGLAVPVLLVGVLFAVWWVACGIFSRFLAKSAVSALLLLNAPCLLFIIGIVVQLQVYGQFLMNAVGLVPQIFFLPIASLAARLFPFETITSLSIYSASALLMLILSALGYAFASWFWPRRASER